MRATASVAMGASPRSAILKNTRRKWPAKGDCDPVRRQFLVRSIAVALHDATMICEQLLEILAASARRIRIDDSRGSAPGPVIARDRRSSRIGDAAGEVVENQQRTVIPTIGDGIEVTVAARVVRISSADAERSVAIDVDELSSSYAWDTFNALAHTTLARSSAIPVPLCRQ
jgi:hypothetical protein